MEQITITFDDVFDIHRSSHIWASTTFGFEANNKRQFQVSVPGWPDIRPGMTVTCLLSEAGNWHTLRGWKDHTTGDISCPSMMEAGFLTVLLPAIVNVPLAFKYEMLWRLPWPMLTILGMIPLASIMCLWAFWKNRVLIQALNALPIPEVDVTATPVPLHLVTPLSGGLRKGANNPEDDPVARLSERDKNALRVGFWFLLVPTALILLSSRSFSSLMVFLSVLVLGLPLFKGGPKGKTKGDGDNKSTPPETQP
jgi:hypothetical protein